MDSGCPICRTLNAIRMVLRRPMRDPFFNTECMDSARMRITDKRALAYLIPIAKLFFNVVYFSWFLAYSTLYYIELTVTFYNCVFSTTQSRIFPLQNTRSDRWSSIFRSRFSGPAFSVLHFQFFYLFGLPFSGPAFSVDP